MSATPIQPSLPFEIILNIIDCIAPSSSFPPIALPAHHPTTKTLLALTGTSRSIYPVARRLLYNYCMYIDTPTRLFRLLNTLRCSPAAFMSTALPSLISALYLRPFLERGNVDHFNTRVALRVAELIQFLYLSLRRLIIDVPLRGRYYEDPTKDPRNILRPAFSKLPSLEEFCSVRDDLYLPVTLSEEEGGETSNDPPVWSLWPRLKTLALYNQDVEPLIFCHHLARVANLKTVILTRADGLTEGNMQQDWKESFDTEDVRPLEIVLVNVESDHSILQGREQWKESDKLKVREINVPTSYYGDDTPSDLCQEWVKRKFLAGIPVSEWT